MEKLKSLLPPHFTSCSSLPLKVIIGVFTGLAQLITHLIGLSKQSLVNNIS
ncbi:MAG: hypothetical protein PHO23_02780 [Candidatus Pacebacteria bacterium]|nr:hypothetical protein [Candidatus Paceibacterota bacterium]